MTSETDPELGQPVEDVPTLEPDDKCNGKRFSGNGEFEGYCENPAGMDTDHSGSGRCKECGGNAAGGQTEAQKLASAQNVTQHGLTADPHNYHETLEDAGEADFVINTAAAIEQRIEDNTGELDFLDEVMARRVAVMIHIACTASDHFAQEGAFERITTDEGRIEVPNRLLEEIRQYNKDIARILDDLGATKNADGDFDAVTFWRQGLDT